MRFTKLRLNGFKSFVDPTDLAIADGLTGVVGPNGCGKSNLLEALRWVMGENRPTAMRGDGMEDVIFAGAATRPARNFAEVSLSVDNTERRAPVGFNDRDGFEIIRRITRDAGSAYKADGKDARARDVQMLFADASTGAHSPSLVRQGQIAELINARPKARRRILEEAAGISGLYQRRHEAELKLKGTEANLARVEDVIGQLAGQLAHLTRQARQAARYREIGAKLRQTEGLLLYRRWKEAQDVFTAAYAELTDCTRAAAQAEIAARQASEAREKRDRVLPPLREEEAIAAAVLQRLQVERDTLNDQETRAKDMVARLTARIQQLRADSAREAALDKDAGETIEHLEREQAQLAQAAEGQDDKLDQAAEAAREAGRVLQLRETTLAELTEDAARLTARHQAAHRLLEDAQKILSRAQAGAEKARRAAEDAGTSAERADAAFAAAQTVQATSVRAAEYAEAALIKAEAARADAQTREADARARRSQAEGEANALKAEALALAQLVKRETSGDEMLLDRIRVTPGYEKALGAALADDLRAPEAPENGASGWIELDAYMPVQSLPAAAQALSRFVAAPAVLARRMSQIGLVKAENGPRLQAELKPGQRLVSPEGDLWRWDGFRTSAEDTPSSAALRLAQFNRLQSLRRDLEEAVDRADGTRAAHETLTRELAELAQADQNARETRRRADQEATVANRALSRAEAERNIAAGKVESLALAVARHEEEAATARARLKEAEAGTADLADLETIRAKVAAVKLKVDDARTAMLAKRSAHDEMRREGAARARRGQEIAKEIDGWRDRLDTAGRRIAELDARRSQSEHELKTAAAAPEEITAKRVELSDAIAQAETRRRKAADRLAEAEADLRHADRTERSAERIASEAREARARSDARTEAAKTMLAHAGARIAEEQGTTPEALLEKLNADPNGIPPADRLDAEVNQLRRQRDALGAVNLRAEEDAEGVREEQDAIIAEKQDLEDAIKKLRAGIAGLNKEGRERLLTAFEEVNRNFGVLFTHLFGGGEANLVLVESDDPLEAGLEIMCQPPGKKLSTLSLLSGGEQTLTALALIFAVFLANPAPICVLDEVDAPLDDANVIRFCDLLDEMTRRTDTRFLIITHHAITMSRMDRLFGVTMREQGVSQLVSVDLKKAETLVA